MFNNADSFDDLSESEQKLLLDYISDNFHMIKSINKKHTAYGLKGRFSRISEDNMTHHVTSQCFMEAMVKSGYKAVPVYPAGTPEQNWRFNVGNLKFTD